MILKALYDYYHRSEDMPPFGYQEKEIHFLVVLSPSGDFLRIEDRRIDRRTCQKFLVIPGQRAGTLPRPNLFYDNLEYVFAIPKSEKDVKKLEKNIKAALLKHQAFVQLCKDVSQKYPENKGFEAVVKFYENNGIEKIKEDPLWQDVIKMTNANVSFILEGEFDIIASDSLLRKLFEREDQDASQCLITGSVGPVVKLTSPTMIPGGKSNAKLVAFQKGSGYDSYGKEQCDNAPISIEAEFCYSAALLKLLDKDSKNKFLIGDRTFVFWASKNNETGKAAENALYALWGYKEVDNPDQAISEMRKVFMSIYSGDLYTNNEDKFYILGLAPNAARIAVVYWKETNLKDFAKDILKHFEDMEIADSRKDKKPYFGIHSMMGGVTISGKSSDVQPNLPEMTIKSIFEGISYPQPLFSAAIRRIRAESGQYQPIVRMAIIKAYLNRLNNKQKKLNVMLDKTNDNQGYVCGRLFAILEYAQYKANGINSIKERYLNSASTTPAAVFGTLLNLSVHHVAKLADQGAVRYIENLKNEVMSLLSSDGFPSHLDLNDQGRFHIGYYHQNQALWEKKDKTTNL